MKLVFNPGSNFNSKQHTKHIVAAINDGVAERSEKKYGAPSTNPETVARKQEYYKRLHAMLPQIIAVVKELRSLTDGGVVKYESSGNCKENKGEIVSANQDLADATGKVDDFLIASYLTHCAIYRTIDIATEEWLRRLGDKHPLYQKLNELTDSKRTSKYGNLGAQKRISSAANQTVLISASFDRFAHNLFTANSHSPCSEQMSTLHSNTLQPTLQLTDLHLEITRHIREVVGSAPINGGEVEVYQNSDDFVVYDDTLLLIDSIIDKLVKRDIDVSDGFIGCPGKPYITDVWNWTGDLSVKYANPLLDSNALS